MESVLRSILKERCGIRFWKVVKISPKVTEETGEAVAARIYGGMA